MALRKGTLISRCSAPLIEYLSAHFAVVHIVAMRDKLFEGLCRALRQTWCETMRAARAPFHNFYVLANPTNESCPVVIDLGTIETLCDHRAFLNDRHVGTICNRDEYLFPSGRVPHGSQTPGTVKYWLSGYKPGRESFTAQMASMKLMERLVKASSKESDLVLEPFCGVGTCLVV